jgi:short-subunit dehydrogenase
MKLLITGGMRGIGLAIAKELYSHGHELLLVARNIDRTAVKAMFPERVNTFAADLSQSGQINTLVEHVIKESFQPDVLVLNAAAFGSQERSVVKPPADELRHLLEVNVLANYQLVQGLVEIVRQGEYPRVVLIGSTAGIRRGDGSVYGISKWALRSYAYSLRNELKELGVGVTLVNPGGTFTERRPANDKVKAGRLLEASDIGKLVAVLLTLSPQAVVEEVTVRPMLGDTY